mgnify:CR=1 FL=1
MIGKLKGLVDTVEDDLAIIDVGGVGYEVALSARGLRALPARQARPCPQPIEGGSTPHALRDGAQARLRSVSGGQRGAPSEHGRRAPTSRREIHISRGDHISRRDIGASNPTMRPARACA